MVFPSLGFPTLHFFLAFLWLVFCEVSASSLPVLLVLGFSCWSLGALLPRSNLRFPPQQGPPFRPRQLPYGFSELLLLPCHAHAFLVPLRWSLSASLLLFLLSCSSSCGSFLLGGPSSSSSVGGFGLGTFFILLWFSLGLFSLVCLLLSSRFPLPSSGSSLVLFWSPSLPLFSFLFLPWLVSFSRRLSSLVCPCVLMSPPRWFLSRHLGFLFFLASFSVCFLPSLGFVLVLFFFNLLRDSVESQFLRDGVLPLGRVFSVGCGCCSFSVCFFSGPSFSVRPWSSSFLASPPPLRSGPSGASGDCSSVPFPSESSTLPTFLPWFPPDPPRASPLCVESVERLPAHLVLRLWLASLSAAVAPPPEGPFRQIVSLSAVVC